MAARIEAALYGGRRRKGADIAPPFANHNGALGGQVDDRGRRHAAISPVQNHIDAVFEPLVNFSGIRARVLFAGQQQSRTHHRLAQFTQQHRRDRMIRHPQADRAAPFMF
jgi:hypothetical protein